MQQNYVRVKVNHMTVEIAQEAPDVVIGMFPVNSNSATVLFRKGKRGELVGMFLFLLGCVPCCDHACHS